MLTKMEGVVELKALESLVSQASKLPVSLPDAKVTLYHTSFGVLTWASQRVHTMPLSGNHQAPKCQHF